MHSFELVPNKIFCRIFDKSFTQSTCKYSKKSFTQNELEVKNNIKSVLNSISLNDIILLEQVHGNNVVSGDYAQNLSKFYQSSNNDDVIRYIQGDASATSASNRVLCIQTADCAPVMLYCPKTNIIGALHAGWRGAFTGVIENTIHAMQEMGAKQIKAFLGPMIRQESYEVGLEFVEQFCTANIAYKRFFECIARNTNDTNTNEFIEKFYDQNFNLELLKPDSQIFDYPNTRDTSSANSIKSALAIKFTFDLPAFVLSKLVTSGVVLEEIFDMEQNTYVLHESYPSYRRSTVQGTVLEGSIFSIIYSI